MQGRCGCSSKGGLSSHSTLKHARLPHLHAGRPDPRSGCLVNFLTHTHALGHHGSQVPGGGRQIQGATVLSLCMQKLRHLHRPTDCLKIDPARARVDFRPHPPKRHPTCPTRHGLGVPGFGTFDSNQAAGHIGLGLSCGYSRDKRRVALWVIHRAGTKCIPWTTLVHALKLRLVLGTDVPLP